MARKEEDDLRITLEKEKSTEGNAQSRTQAELVEDEGGSTEQLDGNEWSVAYVAPGATRLKSSKSPTICHNGHW